MLLLHDILFFQVVWLSGNPLSSEPGCRRRVIRKLQQIKKLDNVGKFLQRMYSCFLVSTLRETQNNLTVSWFQISCLEPYLLLH